MRRTRSRGESNDPGANHGIRRHAGRIATGLAGTGVIALGGLAIGALPASAQRRNLGHQMPLAVTVFSPGNGDLAGANGMGNVIDLSIATTNPLDDSMLSAANGYQPYFNSPAAPTFHPGPDPGAPGLVVTLSTTPAIPGTAFQGPNTNLAGLFQINGVAHVTGNLAETWNTWQVGKAIFGTGPTMLTVYVVKGTAPALVPPGGVTPISNVVTVPFRIN